MSHKELRQALDTTPTDGKPPRRVQRYVYHIHGHTILHGAAEQPKMRQTVPFELALRRPLPIDGDDAMHEVRQEVRRHVVEELERSGSSYIVGDLMIRGVGHLHTILVEATDPEGPAVRILS